jgi:AcrR family transcriptional regulator
MPDARQRRTRGQLRAAILELAASGPVGAVTMGELATAAQVNRSTVYEHTASPQALLESVLLEELDDLRHQHLVQVRSGGMPAASRATMLGVLEHLDRHAVVYRRGLVDPEHPGRPGPLLAVLVGHFRESMRTLLDGDGIELPVGAPEPEIIARFIGDGAAGAVSVWLDLPAPRNPERFVDHYQQLLPGWAGGG